MTARPDLIDAVESVPDAGAVSEPMKRPADMTDDELRQHLREGVARLLYGPAMWDGTETHSLAKRQAGMTNDPGEPVFTTAAEAFASAGSRDAATREVNPRPVTRRTKAKVRTRLMDIVRERGRVYHANVRAPASRREAGQSTREANAAVRQQSVRLFEASRAQWPRLTAKQQAARAYALIARDRDRFPRRLLACSRPTFTAHIAEHLGVATLAER